MVKGLVPENMIVAEQATLKKVLREELHAEREHSQKFVHGEVGLLPFSNRSRAYYTSAIFATQPVKVS